MFYQTLGGIGAAVEKNVLDEYFEFGLDLFIDFKHAGIDDAHVHAGRDGVIEKRRMHSFANFVVATETEGNV